MSAIIKVENVSKQYRLGVVGSGTLKDDVARWWSSVRGKENPLLKLGDTNDRSQQASSNYVWSLQDLNFQVNKGDVIGIIGKNGAGKSTLLKILSRVTAPTIGKIKINGRIASLLEVGTGFHPELTGRENIFLNGAILGMKKREIARKIDDIVAFAGVERYIDTPVKRYSSGMYVRLAFAVAAHLEPDILIIDEVLAVGDAEFQRKCLGKIKDVSNEGRTILFVSHNMAAIKTLCNRALLLENGKCLYDGDVETAISNYLGRDSNSVNERIFDKEKYSTNIYELHSMYVRNKENITPDVIVEDKDIELETNITIHGEPERYHLTFHVKNDMGETMFSISNSFTETKLHRGLNKIKCIFPAFFLQAGSYYLTFIFVVDKANIEFIENDIFIFSIVDAKRELGTYLGKEPGNIRPNLLWINE